MSKIEWTDITINPIHLVREDGSHGGHWCRKISTGCTNCYAESQNQSNYFKFASHLPYSGDTPPNLIFDEEVFKKLPSKRSRRKIFVCSMTDLFGEWVPDKWILTVFDYARKLPQHTFQLLTKRPQRMAEIISRLSWRTAKYHEQFVGCKAYLSDSPAQALPNIWLGVTTENQTTFDDRAEYLYDLKAQGWKTFYSCEPLLSSINLYLNRYRTDWVIVGGESGKKHRVMAEDWALSIRDQCESWNVPFFFKQWGGDYVNCECVLEKKVYQQFPI